MFAAAGDEEIAPVSEMYLPFPLVPVDAWSWHIFVGSVPRVLGRFVSMCLAAIKRRSRLTESRVLVRVVLWRGAYKVSLCTARLVACVLRSIRFMSSVIDLGDLSCFGCLTVILRLTEHYR